MPEKWLVSEVIVEDSTHIGVCEPIPGERFKVKIIALCGKVGTADERESVKNAQLLAMAHQLTDSMREMASALEALEKRFMRLEKVYFAATGEPEPTVPVNEINAAQKARHHADTLLEHAGVCGR